jgi:hypothetical protein
VDIPLFLHVGGSIVSFWVGLFLGNRTAYHPSTRWLRLTFVFTGCYFLLRAIESSLEPPVHHLTQAQLILALVALACWRGWVIGVRGMTRAEHRARWISVALAVGCALIAALTLVLSVIIIGGYLAVTLGSVWFRTWRLYRRETILPAQRAAGTLLVATTIICISVVTLAAVAWLQSTPSEIAGMLVQAVVTLAAVAWLQSTPSEIAGMLVQAGEGMLCGGIALLGYGALIYTRRHAGRNSGRDYLVSGLASLGIVTVYELILIAFHNATRSVLTAEQTLVLGIILVPVLIATHFGFDQLRDALDWLRFDPSSRLLRSMMRSFTRQIGTEKPCDQVVRECLQTLACVADVSRSALFWFEEDEARLLASYGHTPSYAPKQSDLLALRMQPFDQCADYTHLLPLRVARKQRGALLLSSPGYGQWSPREREQLSTLGVLLAAYIDHSHSEPVTIPQRIHRLEEQARDVQQTARRIERCATAPGGHNDAGPLRCSGQRETGAVPAYAHWAAYVSGDADVSRRSHRASRSA